MKSRNYYLEGPDYSGKTTILRSLLKTDISCENFISDRSPLTSLVYGHFFNRENFSFDKVSRLIWSLLSSNDSFIFYVKHDLETLLSRAESRGDEIVKKDDLIGLKHIYDSCFEFMKGTFIEVKTAGDILTFYADLKMKGDLTFDVRKAVSFASNFSFGTNYTLNYEFSDLKDLEYQFWLYKENSSDIINELTYRKESKERNFIISNLIYESFVQIDKYKEGITSRRFIAINNSCFSFVQFCFDEKRKICNYHFTFRSTHAQKILPVDLLTARDIVVAFHNFLNETFKIENFNNNRIFVKINFNNLH